MLALVPALGDDSPILARLMPRLPEIAAGVFEAALNAVPGLENLPEDHFADVMPSLLAGAVAFIRAIEERRGITTEEVSEYVVPVVERHAEDRIPLRQLMTGLFGGARYLWDEIAAAAQPHELPDVVAVGRGMLEALMHITITISEVHSDVEQSIYTVEREARRALCSALLRGAPVEELAARADTALAERYDVLTFHLRPDPLILVADTMVTRRRIRQFQQALDALLGTTVLNTFDGSNGIALLPSRSRPLTEIGEGPFKRLAASLADQFGVDVFVAECPGIPRADLPAAARQSTDLAELARLLGRPTGVYRLDDLLLEYQLTRPGPARDRLAERIAPILHHPHLFETLDAHIRHGSADRKAAAAVVHVHPNTFSYRLRRVAELTGLDPSDPNDSRLLAAALTIHHLYPTPAVPESDDEAVM
ncbi:PucR family transcriptional regulator [Nocardia sp. ET3-3]|uniref:PucR family transcriptional regulator n=1 Tax=Nocardia terrae TaxID=2675851 RepID=A0A7K1UNJ4_9NOCA|nr:helix-turn-helix domain-containing protein [Nocardia terrae]MVU75897.1 PucR family transcriptional regulator [Nocardia terrae]